MFSAKQQKKPVSRTISTPKHKGVGQMARDSQSSMVNRGVIQREEVPLKMIYKDIPDIQEANDLNNGGLDYSDSMIAFTRFNGTTMYSGRFLGCYMAAFVFNQKPSEDDNILLFHNDDKNRISFKDDIVGPTYIAHVFTSRGLFDTKYKFGELANKGIITIKALYLPYNVKTDLRIREQLYERENLAQNVFVPVLGSLEQDENNEWKGNTWWEWQYKGIDSNTHREFTGVQYRPLHSFGSREMKIETYYRMGMIGVLITSDSFTSLQRDEPTEIYNACRSAYSAGLRELGKKKPEVLLSGVSIKMSLSSKFEQLPQDAKEAFWDGFWVHTGMEGVFIDKVSYHRMSEREKMNYDLGMEERGYSGYHFVVDPKTKKLRVEISKSFNAMASESKKAFWRGYSKKVELSR